MARTYTGRKFSLSIFVITNVFLFLTTLGVFVFFAPASVVRAQLVTSLWSCLLFTILFLVIHFDMAFVEYVVHRYILHAPLIRWLSYFYKQHTLHHALTRVRMKRILRPGGPKNGVVENVYPILEDPQHEASFFPWYTFLILAPLLAIFFAPVQWLFPNAPVFLAGFSALLWSLFLYEVIHMLEHKPLEWWLPLFEHPQHGEFWKKVYAFHLRHHADVLCNESVSGFFGLPIPDWIFGTYMKAETLYPHGSLAIPNEFTPPKPRFLGWLDAKAEHAKKQFRNVGAL